MTVNDTDYDNHTYLLRAWKTETNGIKGSTGTPHSYGLKSLTAELYGLIFMSLVIHVIGMKRIRENTQKMVIVMSDKKEAVQQGNEWK